jgi:hypothetical protein
MLSLVTRALAALVLAVLCLTATVAAACAGPVTVNLRVEGQAGTLFEGPITTDAHTSANPINAADSSTGTVGPHPCDLKDNGSNGGFGSALGTPTTTLYDAAQQSGMQFKATWYSSLNDFFVNQVSSDTGASGWGFAVDYTTASVGGCQIGLAAGNNVLWASDFFAKQHLLKLTGPTTATSGQAVTVHVSDGGSGGAIAAASVGGQVTDAQGNAQVTFTKTGVQSLKAERTDSVRSNRLDVCVHNSGDGTCGTSVSQPGGTTPGGPPATPPATLQPSSKPALEPVARLRGIRYGRRFGPGRGPRLLRGEVVSGVAGIRTVRLRLSRRTYRSCEGLDRQRGRFRRTRCGARYAPWFAVGHAASFTVFLPHRLGPGRYVLDMSVTDETGRRDTTLVAGRNRIVFSVAY